MRGGKLYTAEWGQRMTGDGIFAEQLGNLFDVTTRRLGLNQEHFTLSTEHFRKPGEQLALF